MPRVLKKYPASSVGAPPKYKWDEWFDGKPRSFKQGVDFTCKPESFRVQAYNAAKGQVRATIPECGTVVIQSGKYWPADNTFHPGPISR